jgi:hypothetical protein
MTVKNAVVRSLALLLFAESFLPAKGSGTFSMPDSVLLFNGADSILKLVTPDHLETLSVPTGSRNRPLAVVSLGLSAPSLANGEDANPHGKKSDYASHLLFRRGTNFSNPNKDRHLRHGGKAKRLSEKEPLLPR